MTEIRKCVCGGFVCEINGKGPVTRRILANGTIGESLTINRGNYDSGLDNCPIARVRESTIDDVTGQRKVKSRPGDSRVEEGQ
jgi:hypothetical protein